MFSERTLYRDTVRYLLTSKQQTDTVRDELVNTVEHLASGDIETGVGGDQKQRKKEREYWTFFHHVATNTPFIISIFIIHQINFTGICNAVFLI